MNLERRIILGHDAVGTPITEPATGATIQNLAMHGVRMEVGRVTDVSQCRFQTGVPKSATLLNHAQPRPTIGNNR